MYNSLQEKQKICFQINQQQHRLQRATTGIKLVMARIVIFNIRECEFQNEYFILIFANANANITH